MENTDQVLEKVAKLRVSREGGLEHLVRELHLGNKFVLCYPARVTLDADTKELTFDISMNIGVEPHPGLHFGVSFDVDVVVPERPKEVEEEPAGSAAVPPPSAKEKLKTEIVAAGGNPDEIVTPDMTEQKAKEVLDALQGAAP